MLKRILCIPDSFKGTLSSAQIIASVTSVFQKNIPNIEVILHLQLLGLES